ncbi:type-F conjugative transfer system protein TraW [Legionella pneumophila]|uniref:type-F conjugative transfer system protein TraW n=1 Tax=Legionella pneumophila TaxID=446 RepID=UPI0007709886|nr:type-F conjugative transfer system protein TraW [Legionella pneumophila]CZP45182.1 conjugal transfer pilus assembly protein TraW [Legionella pneumophila]
MRKILLVLLIMYFPWVHAAELGVFGKTFVISEMDFMEYIKNKIKTMQGSGEWNKVQNQFKSRVKAHINRPTPLYLPRAIEDKTWIFNPSITVPYDVTNEQGALIIPKGTVVNPLDRIGLSSTLLFFNGDDKEQISWAVEEQKKYPKVKLILTSGSIQDTVNQLKQAVYFDLNGFLCGKFKITHLPARVMQSGNRLQINEVRL